MKDQRRIVIVGGVAGGASAATRARRLNEFAQITLFEKDSHVSFANCGLPYHIGGEIVDRDKLIVVKPDLLRRRFNLDVRTRHEVIGIDRAARQVRVLDRETGQQTSEPYDKLILAPGASPIVPSMAGTGANNVFVLRNLDDTDRIKAWVDQHRQSGKQNGKTHRPRAVVVGAGYIGVEMVEQLARCGLDVTLVELQPQVLPLFDFEIAHFIEAELRKNGVAIHLGDGIAGIETNGQAATGVKLASGKLVPADLVLLGLGVRPNNELATGAGLEIGPGGGIRVNQYQQTSDPDIYAVGDACEYIFGPTSQPMRIPLAGPANRSGRIAGEHAATGRCSVPMAPVLGTSIVRAFGLAAGATGLSDKLSARLGRPARSVTVTAGQHAGYYPGAQQLTLKLTFDPVTRRVLGAQSVGADGVDKRIDIIATALSLGATVDQLVGLDLAYAPQFGSAKDPLHLAAFAAVNQLDGIVDFVPSDADLSDWQIVDVRTDAEAATGMITGARHIPVDQLRDRMTELDRSKPTLTVCGVGLRAYVAARMLMQHGFERVADLTGGMLIRRHARPDVNLVTK